jgi:CPA2 family monovalent cation:H+ antiporter-2
MADDLLIKTLVVILASVCAISLVARLRFPAAGGYLLAGLVIGPHGLQLIAASDEARFLAELGIILLMFMVGLEFSISAMIAARRDVFGAGSLQVGFTVFIVTGIAALSGVSLSGAVLLGGAVAMSSTAITLKQLVDQGEVSSQQGRLVLGILLFQDLAVLPFLVVLGEWQLGGGPEPLGALRQLATATIWRRGFRLQTGFSHPAYLGCPDELGGSISAHRSVARARYAVRPSGSLPARSSPNQ